MMQRLRTGMASLREVIGLIWTDATGFVRLRLVIAHRLSTVVHADEIVIVEGGTIAERGSHAALLRLNGRYAALWEAQQQGTVAA